MCSLSMLQCYLYCDSNVSANRMQSDESWLSKAMLRWSLTSRSKVCANRMQNDESLLSKAMLRCSLILLKAKNNTRTPKSKFWNDIISNLKSFPHPQKCIQPFIYRYFSMFYTQKTNITFHSFPITKTYKNTHSPHIFSTEIQWIAQLIAGIKKVLRRKWTLPRSTLLCIYFQRLDDK